MSKREPILLASDILESAHKILDYRAGQSFKILIVIAKQWQSLFFVRRPKKPILSRTSKDC